MAFNFNPDNNGTVTGRLARDPKVFANRDGSHSVKFVVMANRGYKDDNGKDVADAVPITAVVKATTDLQTTPFASIFKGSHVRVNHSIRMGKPYTDKKTGETVYPGPEVSVEWIKILDTKTATQARMAERLRKAEQENQNLQTQVAQAPAAQPAAQQAQAPATVGAPTQAEPVAENSYDDPPF